jgi:hypothetical protein
MKESGGKDVSVGNLEIEGFYGGIRKGNMPPAYRDGL